MMSTAEAENLHASMGGSEGFPAIVKQAARGNALFCPLSSTDKRASSGDR